MNLFFCVKPNLQVTFTYGKIYFSLVFMFQETVNLAYYVSYGLGWAMSPSY